MPEMLEIGKVAAAIGKILLDEGFEPDTFTAIERVKSYTVATGLLRDIGVSINLHEPCEMYGQEIGCELSTEQKIALVIAYAALGRLIHGNIAIRIIDENVRRISRDN